MRQPAARRAIEYVAPRLFRRAGLHSIDLFLEAQNEMPIRIGNTPDARLQKFITVNLPLVAAEARENLMLTSTC